ncbi:F41 fimbrial protein, partial [Escherichia coli]|nr:F41 fimbrial protein [Escherichia coli]
KSILALAVVASTMVSGFAMAASSWQGQAGTINIGGQLSVPLPTWEWKVGDGLSSFNTTVTPGSGTSVNIPVNSDMMFLSAKMTHASTSGLVGHNLIPKVEFRSYDGTTITPQFNQNKMSLSVKVKDSDSQESLGVLSLPVNYGVVAALNIQNNPADSRVGNVSTGAPGTVFEGISANGYATPHNVAMKWAGLSLGELQSYVQSFAPSQPINEVNSYYNFNALSHPNYTATDRAVMLAYGSGISSGESLTMTLTNPVNKTINWVAPVEVVVTYS